MTGARRLAASLLLAICALAACGTVVSPTSQPAEQGIPYAFQLGHCGITSPIDFDGAMWKLSEKPSSDDVYRDLSGTMTLLDEGHAEFRANDGPMFRLEREPGPVVVQGCA